MSVTHKMFAECTTNKQTNTDTQSPVPQIRLQFTTGPSNSPN